MHPACGHSESSSPPYASLTLPSPPLLLIFFHDKAWLASHPTSTAPSTDPSRALSPTPSAQTTQSHPSSREMKQPHHFEFLLFSYLLRYAHREGKTGDLARAGLLFLFDIAFLTPAEEGGENLSMPVDKEGVDPLQEARDAFGEYIFDGDFAEIMAAGLGAIYSLLPSKLHVPTLAEVARTDTAEDGIPAPQSGGMYLGAELDEESFDDDDGARKPRLSTDQDVRDQLDLLVKLLGFLQDILHRCHSPLLHADPGESVVSNTHVLGTAISDATLDAVNASFIDNVIYPSILESSPQDGSAVAVMTYLEAILSKLDDGPLLHQMLSVLMDTEESDGISQGRDKRPEYYADESRFTLKDLILDNARSPSSQSSTAAFRLLNTLLASHCQHGVKGLIRIIRDPDATALSRRKMLGANIQTTYLPKAATSTDAHLQEAELYGSLISRIDPSQTSTELSAGFSAYLTDMHAAIQADACFVNSHPPLEFLQTEGEESVRVGDFDSDPFQHRMSPGDPLVSSLLESLGRFMCQAPDTNVALTGALTSLALCPNRSLAGWLVYDVPKDIDPWAGRRDSDPESDDDSVISVDRPQVDRHDTSDDPFTAREQVELPALYQILRDLVRQVNRFRLDVDDFDRLLSERRQGLLFADNLDEAMNVFLDVEPSTYGSLSTPSKVESPVPKAGRVGLMGGLKSFLTPKRKADPTAPSSAISSPYRGMGSASRQTPNDTKGNSPFKSHYEQTTYFSLEAHSSPPVSSGPWSPARIRQPSHGDGETVTSGTGHVGTLSVFGGEPEEARKETSLGPTRVTLSSVLDNCVVLEEFLKEVVAVITARRALGVDQVGFVSF